MNTSWALVFGIFIGVAVSAIVSLALIFAIAFVCEVERSYSKKYKSKSTDNIKPVSDADQRRD